MQSFSGEDGSRHSQLPHLEKFPFMLQQSPPSQEHTSVLVSRKVYLCSTKDDTNLHSHKKLILPSSHMPSPIKLAFKQPTGFDGCCQFINLAKEDKLDCTKALMIKEFLMLY